MPKPAESTISIRVVSYGVFIQLTFDNISLYRESLERLPPGCRPAASADLHRRYSIVSNESGGFAVRIDDSDPELCGNCTAMLDFLEGDIQLFVAEHATPHLFVHAGVVAWNGTAILLPGRSFAGKSTLVTSFVKAGATYYSDEYAVLDGDGRVLPYPRLVSLRDGPHGPAGRLDLSAHAPQGDAVRNPIPVGLVALLRYDEASGWNVADLGYLPAIMAMAEQTVAIQRRARDAMDILSKVTRSARVIQGTRGDVDKSVRHILEQIAVTTSR